MVCLLLANCTSTLYDVIESAYSFIVRSDHKVRREHVVRPRSDSLIMTRTDFASLWKHYISRVGSCGGLEQPLDLYIQIPFHNYQFIKKIVQK